MRRKGATDSVRGWNARLLPQPRASCRLISEHPDVHPAVARDSLAETSRVHDRLVAHERERAGDLLLRDGDGEAITVEGFPGTVQLLRVHQPSERRRGSH